MSPNDIGAAGRRLEHARRRSAELQAQASALLAIARTIVHDVRNSKLVAQIMRRRIRSP